MAFIIEWRFAAQPRCSTDSRVSGRRRVKPVHLQSEGEFHTLLDSATRGVQRHLHWRLYRKLRAAIRRYVREFNEAPAFWSLTMSAHSDAALFRLVRLYEPNGGLALERLIETIRASPWLFEVQRFRKRLKDNPHVESLAKHARPPRADEFDRDVRFVAEDERLVSKLLTLRNRVLAHRDPSVILGSVRDPYSDLTARQVVALLKRASTIVNRYWQLYSAGSHLMRIMGEDDYRTVLGAVRERGRERRRQFNEELRRVMGPRSRRTRA